MAVDGCRKLSKTTGVHYKMYTPRICSYTTITNGVFRGETRIEMHLSVFENELKVKVPLELILNF